MYIRPIKINNVHKKFDKTIWREICMKFEKKNMFEIDLNTIWIEKWKDVFVNERINLKKYCTIYIIFNQYLIKVFKYQWINIFDCEYYDKIRNKFDIVEIKKLLFS